MQCPSCQADIPAGSVSCPRCSTPLEKGELTAETGTPGGWLIRTPERRSGAGFGSTVQYFPGALVAGRYEILRLLGEGGMGAVYKAKDRELDRLICLKVIRTALASNPEVLQRFKQE